eukprot:CAMPEP_0115532086 /NCGR_PEP_ID=MMETSP0271-20121206/85399_1 /TAXON_ID=71861 /ORGANISM="Scrippsiella trochoidea, Strain CCMP3099" /LENGTH=42 /DNA_ID= /DNA_START= /DNA_END= /DNA_ORIENTATION=
MDRGACAIDAIESLGFRLELLQLRDQSFDLGMVIDLLAAQTL